MLLWRTAARPWPPALERGLFYFAYGWSYLAQAKICSYCCAAASQLLSRSMPRSCSARKESGCSRSVASAVSSAPWNASAVHGENVQPVPVPAPRPGAPC